MCFQTTAAVIQSVSQMRMEAAAPAALTQTSLMSSPRSRERRLIPTACTTSCGTTTQGRSAGLNTQVLYGATCIQALIHFILALCLGLKSSLGSCTGWTEQNSAAVRQLQTEPDRREWFREAEPAVCYAFPLGQCQCCVNALITRISCSNIRH